MNNKTSIGQTVRYLNGAFARASRVFGSDNRKGTDLYAAQVDFCYLINQIEHGPGYMTSKAITSANELIEKIQPTNQ